MSVIPGASVIVEPTLADLRVAAGFKSQRAAAEHLPFTQARLSQIEDGGSDSLTQLEDLARLYKVSLETAIAANRRVRLAKYDKNNL